jgi:hypothetical protein
MIDLKRKREIIPFSNYFSGYAPNRVSPRCENKFSERVETSKISKEVFL